VLQQASRRGRLQSRALAAKSDEIPLPWSSAATLTSRSTPLPNSAQPLHHARRPQWRDALQLTTFFTPVSLKKGDSSLNSIPASSTTSSIRTDPSYSRPNRKSSRPGRCRRLARKMRSRSSKTLQRPQGRAGCSKERAAEQDRCRQKRSGARQAKRVLEEELKDIESHKASGQAAAYLAQEKLNKATLGMDQAQQNLDKMQSRQPWTDWFQFKRTRMLSGFYFTGCPCRLPKATRSSRQLDCAGRRSPGLELTATLASRIAAMLRLASPLTWSSMPCPTGLPWNRQERRRNVPAPVFSSNTNGNFQVSIQLANEDPRLRSGFTAQVTFHGA